MMGDDQERLFIIIPTEKDILCKWFGLRSLYGFNDDCLFLEQLLTSYSNTPIVCNANALANASYIEFVNKAVVINSSRSALEKFQSDASACNPQSTTNSSSAQRTTRAEITITEVPSAVKQDSDQCSLIDEAFEDFSPDIKSEIYDLDALGSKDLSYADHGTATQDCSVLLARLPGTSAVLGYRNSTSTTNSPANKDARLPVTTNRTAAQSANSCLIFEGDNEGRARYKTSPNVQPVSVASFDPHTTEKPKRRYVRKKPLKSKSVSVSASKAVENGTKRGRSQLNSAEIEPSLTQSCSTAVRVAVERPPSPEIGLQMDVSEDPITTDSVPTFNYSRIARTARGKANVNTPLADDVHRDEVGLTSVRDANSADLLEEEALYDGEPYDDFDYDTDVPELVSGRIFSPIPVDEVCDEQSESADHRDSSESSHLSTLGGSEHRTEVVPGEGATDVAAKMSSKTYERGPGRRSRKRKPILQHCSGKDHHQLEGEPNRMETTLELVDFDGEKLDAITSVRAKSVYLVEKKEADELSQQTEILSPVSDEFSTGLDLNEEQYNSPEVMLVMQPLNNPGTSSSDNNYLMATSVRRKNKMIAEQENLKTLKHKIGKHKRKSNKECKENPSQRKYTQDDMVKAFQLIRSGWAVYKAAKFCKIPCETLRIYYKHQNPVLKPQGKQLTLPEDIETKLVVHINKLIDLGFGLTILRIRELAYNLAEKEGLSHRFNRERKLAGWTFWQGFKNRHKLSLRIPQDLPTVANPMISQFFENLESILIDWNMKDVSDYIFTVDETGLNYDAKGSKIEANVGKRYIYNKIYSDCGETTTVLAGCGASGAMTPMMIIQKGRKRPALFDDEDWKRDNLPPNTILALSDSGWVSEHLFYIWFKCFVKWLNGKPALLIMDRHGCHLSMDVISLADEAKVTLFAIPAYCSHILQPLVSVYRLLMVNFRDELAAFNVVNGNTALQHDDFLQILSAAIPSTFTKQNVKSGFQMTGICPFDPNVLNPVKFISPQFSDSQQTSLVQLCQSRSDMTSKDCTNYSMQGEQLMLKCSLKGKQKTVGIDICPVCFKLFHYDTVYRTGLDWIQCQHCLFWYHEKCVEGIIQKAAESYHFMCSKCSDMEATFDSGIRSNMVEADSSDD